MIKGQNTKSDRGKHILVSSANQSANATTKDDQDMNGGDEVMMIVIVVLVLRSTYDGMAVWRLSPSGLSASIWNIE